VLSGGLRTGRETDADIYFLQQHYRMPTSYWIGPAIRWPVTKVLSPRRCQFGVPHRVLDVAVAEIGL
jgi:hypothetical protein